MFHEVGHLLGKSLEEVGELDLSEVTSWVAWSREYGPKRQAEWNAGLIAAVVINARIGKWRFNPQDFLGSRKKPSVPMGEKQLEVQMMAYVAACGGQILRPNKPEAGNK